MITHGDLDSRKKELEKLAWSIDINIVDKPSMRKVVIEQYDKTVADKYAFIVCKKRPIVKDDKEDKEKNKEE